MQFSLDRHQFGCRLSFLLVLLFLLVACSRPSGTAPLRVGMELAYPPFEMTDENGSPAGVSVDLAEALGRFLGRPVEIQNIPFDGLIPSLRTKRIDLIISSMTATPERAESVAFSDPYLKTGLCLLVRAGSDINSITDADRIGARIAVKKGTTGHAFARKAIRHAAVLVLDKENACVLEVVQGKADAFIYDQMSTYQNWRKNEATTRALLTPFQSESWAVALRKGDDGLRERVNDFLRDYRDRGGFEALGDKWLREQKEAFRAGGIPFYF
jgi:polar amino acid transport system substrate-binding protein